MATINEIRQKAYQEIKELPKEYQSKLGNISLYNLWNMSFDEITNILLEVNNLKKTSVFDYNRGKKLHEERVETEHELGIAREDYEKYKKSLPSNSNEIDENMKKKLADKEFVFFLKLGKFLEAVIRDNKEAINEILFGK